MKENSQDPRISFIIGQFRRGAIVLDYGCQDDDKSMQDAGWSSVQKAVDALDSFGPEGRQALIPLLDDPEPAIRVMAAGYLVRTTPRRALAVLKEINETSAAEASMTAFRLLRRHARGELNM